jgi:glucose/arabinose dehydrogenase
MHTRFCSLLITLLLLAQPGGAAVADGAFDPASIALPPGFAIEQVAAVPNARAMVWGEAGTLFVSTMTRNRVYAVSGILGGEPAVVEIAEKLRVPNGVAFRDGALYVAEPERLLRYDGIEGRLDNPPEPVVLADDLPAKKQHAWKYIAFGPDGKLYVTVGSPCNVCDEPDYGTIIRMNPDGSEREVYARGIRNSVGIDWHPVTGELWFTDNNRDMMGDDVPPGELNHAPRAGLHFGFPFCHGTNVVEPEPALAALGSCANSRAPAQELGAHVAPLGLEIYAGEMFPPEYRHQVFIAEHGSWNRSEKLGYRVSLVRLDAAGNSLGYEIFASGWLSDGQVNGRPVDLLTAPDGSLLLSDDRSGAIYRISYTGP